MLWTVKIHRLVLSDDFKSIDPCNKDIIFKAIRKKLSTDPEAYGRPLSGELSGYWRLRVDDFRVIYRIVTNEILVLVVKVGPRRNDEVYKKLANRLKRLEG